jgi:hypothetical protein
MDLTKLAAGLSVLGGVLLSVGVGFYDWRAGLIVAGLLLTVAGISSLRSQSG